ncbi:amino acid ABC transporter ATP-binding protein [Candidatus Methylospira mobilis]|uniref:Amino acid ABC transporter ATP-binding protein n=1 Tax=Candidatus Methylospira mobilis TaxID=1808979 RepID=A0A5Q0BHF8_9GAMM|nr:amino acid ABC transporter ATP-binding protein [Candidatus Methylospira mobilis]QFY41641.1 amino acid ABC transporter ATP-binding protein [Candidatus Methylospira mobilis]
MRVKLNGLQKSFSDNVVLKPASLELPDFHALVLIGPSGGGKTTLLRILAGLETPDRGMLEIDGQAMSFDERNLLHHRRSVGTVFQSYNLFPHLSALENIVLPLEKAHGYNHADAAELAMSLLERFRLAEHAHKKPAQMSGGQQQRVAIARAVAIKPRFLLFDEPTSALDPEMTGEVLDLIEELRSEGRDLILVTHQMGFARRVADQAVFLSDGCIVETGPTSRLFDQPDSADLKQFLQRVFQY